MKLDEPAAAATLPGRDRIVVAGLLLLVAALAWGFTVHQSILMDEMEAAYVAGHEYVDERYGALVEHSRCRHTVCYVVGDDGGNDDTGCEPDDHRFRNN